jgi:hypothetical protein
LNIEITPKTGSAHGVRSPSTSPLSTAKHAELVLHWGTIVVPMAIDVP